MQVAATDGEWILEVEVPDDDMGPILAAKSQLDEDIKAGREKPDATLKANFISMTDPDHLYPAYVRRIAPSAETITEDDQYKNRHIVKVTLGFTEAVQKEYMAQYRPRRCGRGPRSGHEIEMRHGPTWLTSCSASRSRSSTNRSCSAGRSCIERIDACAIELMNHQICVQSGSNPVTPLDARRLV